MVTPGYSHLSETISQLSSQASPHPGFMVTGFITYGLLMIGLAYELSRCIGLSSYAKIIGVSFAIHGIGFMLAGILRADPDAVQMIRTPTGILHNISVIVGCLAFLFGMFIFARIAFYKTAWRSFARFSFVVLSLILAIFFISQLPAVAGIDGLMQRIYITPSLIWIQLVSTRCVVQPATLT